MSFFEDAKGAAALGAGSGGGGGTDNYEELNNLPEINGVTLAGNKSSSDLSLQGEIEDLSDIRSGAGAGATAVQTIKIGNETQTKTSGVVALPAYPTTLPASDTTSTYSATGTAPVNGTAVAAALGGLSSQKNRIKLRASASSGGGTAAINPDGYSMDLANATSVTSMILGYVVNPSSGLVFKYEKTGTVGLLLIYDKTASSNFLVVGDSGSQEITLNPEHEYDIRHYAGSSMTLNGTWSMMICSKAEWDASQDFAPYIPTIYDVYQLLAQQ